MLICPIFHLVDHCVGICRGRRDACRLHGLGQQDQAEREGAAGTEAATGS